MYKNLRAEILRCGYTMSEFAPLVGLTPQSFSSRVNGKTDFTFKEACKIKEKLGVDLSLEELFKEV